jgi:hypothetical protein
MTIRPPINFERTLGKEESPGREVMLSCFPLSPTGKGFSDV